MSLLSRIKPLIFVAAFVCAYPLIALADPAAPPGPAGDPPRHEHGMDGCAMMMHEGGHDGMMGGGPWHGHGGMFGGAGMFGEGGALPPFVKALHLSEAQQDKVFAIMHAQAPQAREQAKTVRKAHQAVHELVTSALPSMNGGIGAVAGSMLQEAPITSHALCIGHSAGVLEAIEWSQPGLGHSMTAPLPAFRATAGDVLAAPFQ